MNKINKYSHNNSNLHLHTHNHSHEGLYGESKEVPAVFSYSTSFEFDREVTGKELQDCLVDWIESLKLWVAQNKYFIGHIKVFAESGESYNLWLSTTGKKVNIKCSEDQQDNNIKNVIVNMTVIIFGAEEKSLRLIALESLDRKLPSYCK